MGKDFRSCDACGYSYKRSETISKKQELDQEHCAKCGRRFSSSNLRKPKWQQKTKSQRRQRERDRMKEQTGKDWSRWLNSQGNKK